MAERMSVHMRGITVEWLTQAAKFDHLFQMRWLGERFFHLPGDMVALQSLVWQVRPSCIVQTGVAAGGGVVFSASMLELTQAAGRVVAVEPRLREEVRERLGMHPLAHRMHLVAGDSCAPDTLAAVTAQLPANGPVMVILDLNPTHAHVLRELRTYADWVTPGSYLVVMDTILEYLPETMFAGKPYGRGNNPATAVQAFLAEDARFRVDEAIEDHVLMTLSPGGFLQRVG
ncbi:cephalosporin hydroxylase family protein [Achromobacter sp. GG226]|uniref:cephalosporin hydroxylase family protein n=1 Tax=Verticiella alkaliphila TaxID=2779529 RepID=UPI001C0BFC61|nr:CmcI family methyltransferase [Verticiella sp. GG226]MBU4612518.1 cephalosporin hydroxylase family protein [Verticiella sp. GG226]